LDLPFALFLLLLVLCRIDEITFRSHLISYSCSIENAVRSADELAVDFPLITKLLACVLKDTLLLRRLSVEVLRVLDLVFFSG
jgi:hypothetical protein